MIMLQCSTRRACGTGHGGKRYGVITAPDRWMTSFTLPVPSVNLSVGACTCASVLTAYRIVRSPPCKCMSACMRLSGLVNVCVIWPAGM